MPLKRRKEAQGKAKVEKPVKKRPEVEEEISSGSDSDEDVVKRKKPVESSDEEDVETAQEKRVRLAKEYVQRMRAEEEEKLDDEFSKKEAIVHRLRDEQLELAGKLKKPLAALIDDGIEIEETILKCRVQNSSITCLAVSKDMHFVFTGSRCGNIVKYDLVLKAKTGHIPYSKNIDPEKPTGHSKRILCLAVSDDLKYLASGSDEKFILLWNPVDLTLIRFLRGHAGSVNSLTIQKGLGKYLYSASSDKTVKVWSLEEMAYIETLFGHVDAVLSIDCLRNERALSCGGREGSVRLWKIPEESQLVFNGDGNCVDVVCFLNDDHFVSGDDHGLIALWNVHRKKPSFTVKQAHGSDMSDGGNPCWITALASVANSDVFASG